MEKNCLFCEKKLPNDRFKHLRKYCSRKCSRYLSLGRITNVVISSRIKRSWVKRRQNKRDTAWNKGKDGQKGESNYFWRGGKRAFTREKVLKRDNYTCKKCGLRNTLHGFMDVDHDKPKSKYPELKYSIENQTTLCPNCHRIKTLKNGELVH